MRTAMMIGLATLGLAAALGCGGAWNEAMEKQVGEMGNELLGELSGVADSPEKATVEAAINDVKANAGEVGFMEISVFAAELKQAMSDGVISPEEAAAAVAKKDEILQ